MTNLPGAKAFSIALLFLFWVPYADAEEEKAPAPELAYTTPVGSRIVDTGKLAPYNAVWVRHARADEESDWAVSGSAEETLEVDENGRWRHTLIIRPKDRDMKVVATRTLDQETFRPLHFLRTLENGPEAAPVIIEHTIGPIDVSGYSLMADGTKTPFEKELAMPMFDGFIVGLVIAALPLEEGYRETLPTSIPTLNSTYWLEIYVTGKMPYEVITGEVIEVWEVTVNWYNIDDDDWYPPGRDDWGGAYYIAVEPGNGVPFVVEYAHSTLVLAWDGVRRTPGN